MTIPETSRSRPVDAADVAGGKELQVQVQEDRGDWCCGGIDRMGASGWKAACSQPSTLHRHAKSRAAVHREQAARACEYGAESGHPA